MRTICTMGLLAVGVALGACKSEDAASSANFECGDGDRVARELVCDGIADCLGAEDERHCQDGGTPASAECKEGETRSAAGECVANEPPAGFLCGNGERIPLSWYCDGAADCEDKSDEFGCPGGGLGPDAGTALQDAATVGSDAVPPGDPPNIPEGAVVEDMGLVVVGGDVLAEPLPRPTASGFEPLINEVSFEATEDGALDIVIDATTVVAPSKVYLSIGDVNIVIPVAANPARPNIVPGWEEFSPGRFTVDECSAFLPVGSEIETAGCYPPCMEACDGDTSCIDAENYVAPEDWVAYRRLECVHACSRVAAEIDECVRYGACRGGEITEELYARYGSAEGFALGMNGDRLDGALCALGRAYTSSVQGVHASVQALCEVPTCSAMPHDDPVCKAPSSPSLQRDIYDFWQCTLEGAPPASENTATTRRTRTRVRVAPVFGIPDVLQLDPMIALESPVPAGPPAVSEFAAANVKVCVSRMDVKYFMKPDC